MGVLLCLVFYRPVDVLAGAVNGRSCGVSVLSSAGIHEIVEVSLKITSCGRSTS